LEEISNKITPVLLLLLGISGDNPTLIILSSTLVFTISIVNFSLSKRPKVSIAKSLVLIFIISSISALFALLPLGNYLRLIFVIINLFAISYFVILIERKKVFDTTLLRLLILAFLFPLFEVILPSTIEGLRLWIGHAPLENLVREADISILGKRYYGLFQEPSYFVFFVSLVSCLYFYITGRRTIFILLGAAFILSPSPNVLFGPCFLLLAAFRTLLKKDTERKRGLIFTVFCFLLMSSIFLAQRLDNIGEAILAGNNKHPIYSSESVRLVLPTLVFLDNFVNNRLPLEHNCIQTGTCSPYSAKLPILTIWSYFGLLGFVLIMVLGSQATRSAPVIFFLGFLISSIFVGGGAFTPTFLLMVVLSVMVSGTPKLVRAKPKGDLVFE
jgi:hypothetical protein